MSKSQSKKEETKKKADLWYSKFSTMLAFSGCLESIALDIGDGKSVRIWMRHTGQLTKDDVLFHLKRLTDRIDVTEQKAREIRNKYSDRFADMAKRALGVLEVIRFQIEQVNSDIVFHGSNESVEWLRQRCLDAHERASEYCRKLKVLSSEFQIETIEPPGVSGTGRKGKAAVSDDSKLPAEVRALAVLAQHPDWTNKQIAEKAKIHPKSLYRFERFMAARHVTKEVGKQKFHIGRKSKNGDIEAED